MSCALEFSYFFSLPQYTFTSHSSLLESSFWRWAPWEHLWLPCCPGGSRDSAVWSLWSTLGLSGNSMGPLNTATPMPLNQSKPLLSFLLYSAFAFLYFFSSMLPPPSLGHWYQTDLLCAGACFCSSFSMCRWTDECTCLLQHFNFIFPCIHRQSMHLLSASKISSPASFTDFPYLTFNFGGWIVCRNIVNKNMIAKEATHGSFGRTFRAETSFQYKI